MISSFLLSTRRDHGKQVELKFQFLKFLTVHHGDCLCGIG